MEKLWSPWRSKYIESFKTSSEKTEDSLFTHILNENDDDKHFLLHRGKKVFVIMNLYPYNSGHLLIVPYVQSTSLSDLDEETKLESMNLLDLSCKALDDVMKPQGFNIGVNIGKCSGAGVDDHLHFHIVPRWNGDTNFMPVLNDVKIVSEAMEDTYKKLKASFSKLLKS